MVQADNLKIVLQGELATREKVELEERKRR